MKNILLLDFASEMNRGDAAMQEAILDIVDESFPDYKKNIVCVYGDNQEHAFGNHFDCSNMHGVKIHPGVRSSYNPLSDEFKAITRKKQRSLLSMFVAYLKLLLLTVSGGKLFFGRGTKAVRIFKKADIVLWNGRNFRDRAGIGEFYDLMAMLLHPLMCLIFRKKIYAIGVSIWPLRYPLSRKFLAYVLSRCVYVTARETFSYDYANKVLGLKNVKLSPDLSYYFINKYRNDDSIERDLKLVSFTLVDWRENGHEVRESYKASIASLMRHLLDQGYKVQVVPQVFYEWEGYTEMLNEIYESHSDLKGKIIEIRDYLTPKQLFAEYRKSGCLIATRMHSAIFALTHMCKVICIPYDAGAKWHIVTDMGLDARYLIDYQKVNPKLLIEAFDKIMIDDNIHNTIIKNLPGLIEDTPKAISNMNC